MNIRPLTKKQQQFAEQNHDLVYAFLNVKKLPEIEYYDVIIFGYLKAVQEFCDTPDLHKYHFPPLAWKRMRSSMFNHIKYLSGAKRNVLVVSLSEPIGSKDGLMWQDTICYRDELMIELEMSLLLQALSSVLPSREMRIIRMKVYGVPMHRIAKSEHMTFKGINGLIADVYKTVISILWG